MNCSYCKEPLPAKSFVWTQCPNCGSKLTQGTDLPTERPDDTTESVGGAITEVGGGQTETDELDTILNQAVKPKLKRDVINLLEKTDMEAYKRGFKEAEALSHHQTEQVLTEAVRLVKQLSHETAKYGDGTNVYYRKEAVIRVSKVLAVYAELARLRGEQGA
jgi:hypothetical protein